MPSAIIDENRESLFTALRILWAAIPRENKTELAHSALDQLYTHIETI